VTGSPKCEGSAYVRTKAAILLQGSENYLRGLSTREGVIAAIVLVQS
jgi:hypothetical protein